MERPSAEAPRRRRWGPPVADLPSATTPPAQAAPGCASRTGRESTDGARLADPRTATSRDGCASTRDGPATTSTPQSSGRPADESPESTTASREKRRRRSRWDAPGDGIVAVARGPSDRPDAVAVVPTRARETGATRAATLSLSLSRREEGTNERAPGLSQTDFKNIASDEHRETTRDDIETTLPPAGVLTLPGGVVAKLPASFLCERDAPIYADAATRAAFAELARINRAEILFGELVEDEGLENAERLTNGARRIERKRSPSPEPVYGPNGARVNTRERRETEKLVAARAATARAIKKLCPSFTFPESYAPPKVTRKIFVPVAKHPGYNFFGLIIGPRGNTQKQMQRDFGVKIVIRGRGSEKKASLGATETSRVAASLNPTEEPMHVLVTGDDDASVDAAAAAVARLLEPLRDEENEHKRAQLRELAVLNGTLRERADFFDASAAEDADDVGVGPGSALPPGLRARVAAQYEKDARATRGADDGDGEKQKHDAAYRAFLEEVGVAEKKKTNAGGETRDDDDFFFDASAVDRRKAYVGRLPSFAAEHTVRLTFQPFGAIEKIEVVPDRERNLPCRGFAFVQFRDAEAARAAATYFSTRATAFPHPPPPGFAIEPFRAMDVRVKSDPRPPTVACVRDAQATSAHSHDPRCRLYVAKLPPTFSGAELRSLVAASLAGSTAASAEPEDGDATGSPAIVSCDVVVDRLTGLGRGIAFVRMRDAHLAARVVAALDGVHVENRGLVVRVAAEKNRPRDERADPSRPPSGYPTGGGFVTPLSGDPCGYAGVYANGNPFAHYDPRAVAAAEAAVAAANPALAAAAAAEMAARSHSGPGGPGPGPAAFFPGAHAPSPGIFSAGAATIAPGDPAEAPPPPPP